MLNQVDKNKTVHARMCFRSVNEVSDTLLLHMLTNIYVAVFAASQTDTNTETLGAKGKEETHSTEK